MRDLYLLDEDVVFLNHGSFGACPRAVFDRYQAWQRELERQPVEFLGRRHDALIVEALAALGDYLGTSGDNLVFVPNATNGLNMIARSLDLRAGDQVLTTNHEYGALDLTWSYIARERGCEIVPMTLPAYFDDQQAVVDCIWQGVTDQTKVIFLSHITSPTALILPVAEICARARQAGILTVIDGAHVPGHIPLDLDALGVDFYSGNCHKWLSAPKGSAFAYIHPRHHALIDPLTISWGWGGDTLFERTRWQGTRDIAPFLTVPDAIAFQQVHDWQTVQARCHQLAIATMHRIGQLTDLPPLATPDFFGQMVAVPLPPESDLTQLKIRLYDDYRVEVPLIDHPTGQYIRVSIQAYNTPKDTEVLLTALRALL
ncbi:MAG: aminotransferase class V-fold PLP-dependent enzyme [Anaerolineae bacterium]